MENELEITLKRENNVGFEMTADGEEKKTIIKMDENGHIDKLWDSAQKICETYLHEKLIAIGEEMKA